MKALIYGIKNSVYEIIYFIIVTIANLIIRKLLIENIHIEVVALQQILNQIITVITLVEFGISKILLYYLYPALKRNNKKKINNIMNTFKDKYLKIGITVLILGIIVIPFLPFFLNDFEIPINYYIIFIIMLIQNVITLLFSYKVYLLHADQKSYVYLKVMILFKLIFIVFAYVVIKYSNNCYLYYLFLCIFELLTYLTISNIVDKKYNYIVYKNDNKKPYDKEIYKHIKSTAVTKIFAELNGCVDVFVISILTTGFSLGVYSNYLSIFNSLYLIVMKIFSSFKATIAKFMDSKSLEYSYQVYNLFELTSYAIALFTSVIFYLLIDTVIAIWLGRKYIIANEISLLLSIQLFIYIFRMSQWNTNGIKGWFSISRITDTMSTILNFVLSIILFKKYGLAGIIQATLIAQSIQCIIELIYILKKFKKLNLKNIVSKLSLIILYFILILSIYFKLLIGIIVGIVLIIYLIVLFRGRCIYVFKNKKNY